MDIFFNLVLSTNASTFPEPAQNSGNLGVIQVIFKRNDSGIFHFQIILQLKMLFFFIQFRETKLQSYSPPILIPSCFLLVKWNYNKKYAESVFEEFIVKFQEILDFISGILVLSCGSTDEYYRMSTMGYKCIGSSHKRRLKGRWNRFPSQWKSFIFGETKVGLDMQYFYRARMIKEPSLSQPE